MFANYLSQNSDIPATVVSLCSSQAAKSSYTQQDTFRLVGDQVTFNDLDFPSQINPALKYIYHLMQLRLLHDDAFRFSYLFKK